MDSRVTYGKPAKSRAREWLACAALACYAAAVLVATLSPTPLDQGYSGSIKKLLAVLHRNGVPDWLGYSTLEFSANIVMFLPLGFLVTMLLAGRLWWLALVICPALSVAIELSQAAFLSARFAAVSDVVANSIGAILGVLLALALRAVVHRRDEKMIARALWDASAGVS